MTEFTFTMQQLRDSLDDKTLRELLENDFDSTRLVKLKKRKVTSKFAEDDLFTQSPLPQRKARKLRKPTVVTPSQAFIDHVKNYDQGINEGTAETVLGVYFQLYLRLFGEEDAAWNGNDMKPALSLVKLFASSVTGGNYRHLIVFIRRIMPLWKHRLQAGEEFPGSRPTLEQLFGGKRYFWTNRKIIFNKWQRPM